MTQFIDATILEQLTVDAKSVWPRDFDKIEAMFHRCCFAISFNVIRKLDIFQKRGDFETLNTIREKVGLFKDAEYVMGHMLRILCDEEVLAKKDDGFVCIDNEPYIETPSELLVSATRQFPHEGAPFQWLARASDGLVNFIQGTLFAEEVMFPGGSFKLVEEVYNTSTVYGFYSRMAGIVIKRLIETHFSAPVHMFEIGAGTGNGTANVLNETNDRFARYTFTDVGKALVQMGQRRFKKSDYDFLEYKVFDASNDITEQGIVEGQMDIVLAVNVLHAMDNVSLGLKNARKLLKEGGILVLSEISPAQGDLYRYMELTFGMLPSYSVYSDRDLRPHSPLMRPAEWKDIFEKAGFRQIESIPGDMIPEMDRGGIIIGVK